MKTVRVVGAGLNGLLTAFYLLEKGHRVEIYEKKSQAGGMLQTTVMTEPRRLMEASANALLADAEVERVAAKIGLTLKEHRRNTTARWIFRSRRRRWPVGVLSSLSLGRFLLKKSFGSAAVRPRPDETLQAWGERAVGRAATAYLLEPACLGIFAAPAKDLSATLIYDYFFGSAKKEKGRLRGSVAPKEGMAEWPAKLQEYLQKQGVVFHFGATPEKNEAIDTVIATDMRSSGQILSQWGDSRGTLLSALPTVDLISINAFFFYRGGAAKGFGILFPRDQGIEPLGVLFNDFIFYHHISQHDYSNTWIYGDVSPAPVMGWSDEELLGDIKNVRESKLRLKSQMSDFKINRWPAGLPLYGVALEKALRDLPISQNRVHLIGNYLGEIGLNRFFHRAKALVEKI